MKPPQALLQFFDELGDEQAASLVHFFDSTPEGQVVLILRKHRVCSYKLTEHGEVQDPRHRSMQQQVLDVQRARARDRAVKKA